jgi:hypothetical protein
MILCKNTLQHLKNVADSLDDKTSSSRLYNYIDRNLLDVNFNTKRFSSSVIISKFDNGEEKLRKSPFFNTIIEMLIRGYDIYQILDETFKYVEILESIKNNNNFPYE